MVNINASSKLVPIRLTVEGSATIAKVRLLKEIIRDITKVRHRSIIAILAPAQGDASSNVAPFRNMVKGLAQRHRSTECQIK